MVLVPKSEIDGVLLLRVSSQTAITQHRTNSAIVHLRCAPEFSALLPADVHLLDVSADDLQDKYPREYDSDLAHSPSLSRA